MSSTSIMSTRKQRLPEMLESGMRRSTRKRYVACCFDECCMLVLLVWCGVVLMLLVLVLVCGAGAGAGVWCWC